MKFKKYRRTNIAEMHEYDTEVTYPKEFMDRVSISKEDLKNVSP